MDRPSGDDIAYFYDARGALTLLKEGASNRAIYSYDDAGVVTKTLLGNSSYTEYLFDGVGRLTLLSNKKSDASVISSFAYALDDTGNRTKMGISGSAYTAAEVTYGYDDAYQLTSEVRTGGNAYAQTFVYDASGNRTKSTLAGVDTTYLYNEADQLTSETTGQTTTTYLYDSNGALSTSDDGTTVKAYTYNYDGYLASFDTTGTDNDATYTYDADKRRIAKVVDSGTTKYFLEGANVIADYDGDNVLLATYLTPGLDNNVSVTRSGSTYYYMKDGLGNIRNLLDSDEATTNVYDYYGFGKELGSWTEGVTNRYTYTSREYDPESAQYYYRARYYSGAGRFLSRDPVGTLDRAHVYIYVNCNPALLTDSKGLSWILDRGGPDWQLVDEPSYTLYDEEFSTQKPTPDDYQWHDYVDIVILYDRLMGNVDLVGAWENFQSASGGTWEVEFHKMLQEEWLARNEVVGALSEGMYTAEQLSKGGLRNDFRMREDRPHHVDENLSTRNWIGAVNQHWQWSKASVSVNCEDGRLTYTMKVKTKMEDAFVGTPLLSTVDNVMFDLHITGLSRFFRSWGMNEVTLKWGKGKHIRGFRLENALKAGESYISNAD